MSPGGERESTAGVLGVGVALLLLLALFLSLTRTGGGPVDGSARLAELLEDGTAPFGLELVDATRSPTGRTVVRLAREADAAPSVPGPGGDVPPAEAAFVEHRARGPIRALFEGEVDPESLDARRKDWEEDPAEKAFDALVRRDRVVWRRWSAELVVVRSFDEDGGWHETARVDLSRPGHPLALVARWPAETPVSEEALRELLRAVRVQPAEEEDGTEDSGG